MLAVVGADRPVVAVEEPRFRAGAPDVVQQDRAVVVARRRVSHGAGARGAEAQLTAHDARVDRIEAVVAHGAPDAVVVDLEQARVRPAVDQAHICARVNAAEGSGQM